MGSCSGSRALPVRTIAQGDMERKFERGTGKQHHPVFPSDTSFRSGVFQHSYSSIVLVKHRPGRLHGSTGEPKNIPKTQSFSGNLQDNRILVKTAKTAHQRCIHECGFVRSEYSMSTVYVTEDVELRPNPNHHLEKLTTAGMDL
jgi:hypothetical protein